MRNLKRALSLTLASVMLLGMMVVGSSAKGYDDVKETDNVEAIEVAQAIEVMVGDERGFGPDRPVNRAEMAVVMGKLLNLDYDYYATSCPFNDVYDWARGWVGACYANKIVSGRGDGIYDPGATVTAVEAASMLMRALGYFQYQNDYADGFELSTVRQGTKIRIFDGVGSSATEPMTRNQVAQMVLNALQTGMVEPDGNTINLTTPDGTVFTGKVNYVNVTSRKDFAYAISKVEATSIGSQNSGAIVELGEKLYNGDLELDDTRDDFGRPARDWKFEGKAVGTYVKKELIRKEWTAKVTGKDLYDEITKSILDDPKYNKNVFIDGQDDSDINDKLFALNATALRNNKDGVGATGNGVLTQLFIDPKAGNDYEQKDVTVAIINTYLAKARADYSEKKDEVDFNVYGIEEVTGQKNEYKKFIDARKNNDDDKEILTVSGDDFSIADIKKDDAFLVTVAQGDIQTIEAPEVISAGTMSAFKQNDNVVVNGTQYDYSSTAEWNYKVLDRYTGIDGRENLKDKSYDVYLDKYGYAIGVDLVDQVDNYIFITGVDDDLSNRYARNIKANGIFLDGTMKEITYDATDSSTLVPSTGVAADLGLVNTWCTYTVSKDGIYTLKQVANKIDTAAGNDIAQTWDKDIASSTSKNTIDKKNIDLKSTTDSKYARVYGNDATVYLNASVKTINVKSPAPTSNWHGIIDDVDSVTVGIDNVSLDVYKQDSDPTGGSTAAAADTAAAVADENGKVASGNYCYKVSYGAYALYDDDGYIIAAVTVADDGSTNDNWVYVVSSSVTRESYDADKDEWTWSREVVLNGELTEITYKGDALKYLQAKANDGKEGMLKYNWYEVKYKGDGNVKNVKLAFDALAHAAKGAAASNGNPKDDKYEGNIDNLEWTVQNGKDTILYEASKYQGEGVSLTGQTGYGAFTNEKGQPYLDGRTFYVNTTTTTGFRVNDSTKVVFIQTNKNDENIYYYEGPDKLEDVVESLNKGKNATEKDGKYNYEISAVLDGNVARVVVVRDLNKDNGANVNTSGNEGPSGPTGYDLNVLALLDKDGTTDTDGKVTFVATGTDKLDRATKRQAVKEAYIKAVPTATEDNTEVKWENNGGTWGYAVYVGGAEEGVSDFYTEATTDTVKAPALPTPAEQWESVKNDDDPRNAGEWRPLVTSGFLSNSAKFTPTGEIEDSKHVIEVSNLKWNTDFDVKVPGFFYVVGGTPQRTIREAYNIQADGTLYGSNNDTSATGVVTGFAIVPVLKVDGNITNYIVFRDADGDFYNASTGASITGTITNGDAKLKLTTD